MLAWAIACIDRPGWQWMIAGSLTYLVLVAKLQRRF